MVIGKSITNQTEWDKKRKNKASGLPVLWFTEKEGKKTKGSKKKGTTNKQRNKRLGMEEEKRGRIKERDWRYRERNRERNVCVIVLFSAE